MAENFRRYGALRDRLHFQKRASANDGWSDVAVAGAGAFATQFSLSASLRSRIGSEAVTAARLDGRQPFVVTVRNDPRMQNVTTAWRLVDARKPSRVLNIVSPPADPDGKSAWLEFLAVEGQPS